MKNTRRYDFYDLLNPEVWLEGLHETEEGFLSGKAVVTTAGVFMYKDAIGNVHGELRPPEEVFDRSSLESMKLAPITLNHPADFVTSDNIKELQVGSLGSMPSNASDYDGLSCVIDMRITDKKAIEEVNNGKRGLSMGYTCDLEERSGVWCGIPYDYVQHNIRYNHCAIVDTPRAGDKATIKLRKDSADAVLTEIVHPTPNNTGGSNVKKINLDGIEYEADEKVLESYVFEKKRADSLNVELEKAKKENAETLSKLTAERDTAKERCDSLEKELADVKANALSSEKIDALVAEKLALRSNAELAGVEYKADMADADVKKAIILKYFPSANLDGKDEVYLNARYDSAVELAAAKKADSADADKADANARTQLNGGNPEAKNDGGNVDHRALMIDAMKKRSRGEEV